MPIPTILIAEDDDLFRAALSVRLRHAGYRVIEAADGETAVTLARAELPDLLILDVHMPRADGLAALDDIDSVKKLNTCPVIYITGDKTEKTECAATKRGAFSVFHKPVNMSELLSMIDHLAGPAEEAA